MPINKITDQDVDAFKTTIRIHPSNLMDEYQRIASGSAIYPGSGGVIGLIYCSLKLNGEAGELAEHVGKSMRDDGSIDGIERSDGSIDFRGLSLVRRELVVKEIGDCLWYLSAICRELGLTLSEAAYMNLVKLQDRQKRNALQGSGDER